MVVKQSNLQANHFFFDFRFSPPSEILCEALYFGIDAGMRTQAQFYPTGITMISGQIAK